MFIVQWQIKEKILLINDDLLNTTVITNLMFSGVAGGLLTSSRYPPRGCDGAREPEGGPWSWAS